MGNCFGGSDNRDLKDPNSIARNKQINKQIGGSRVQRQREVKILLLGSGESGKSTILKQMKIIHKNGYTQEELTNFRELILSNTLGSMRVLVQAAFKLRAPIEPQNADVARKIANINQNNIVLHITSVYTPQLGRELDQLWKDSGIRWAFDRRAEYQLNDSAEYYFNNLERISGQEYSPTEQDVLRCRVKTTSIIELDFNIGDYRCKLIDVGGQRTERKKWLHCFEGVHAVIWVASLSEFDQKCYEDDSSNRMEEAMMLFEEVVNSKWFSSQTYVILFLNKFDLFTEKAKKVDLNVCFPQYSGGKDPDIAAKFIVEQYKTRYRQHRELFFHIITATDTDCVKRVFDSMAEILRRNQAEAEAEPI